MLCCCAGRHPQHQRRRLLGHQGQVSHRGHAGEWPSRGRCRGGSARGRTGRGGTGHAGTGRSDQDLEWGLVACMCRRAAEGSRRASPCPRAHRRSRGGGPVRTCTPAICGVAEVCLGRRGGRGARTDGTLGQRVRGGEAIRQRQRGGCRFSRFSLPVGVSRHQLRIVCRSMR